MIAGAGRVGQNVARELVQFGFDIVIIEKNAKAAAMLESSLDVRVIREDALNVNALRQAVKEAPDAFIAVTESDEVNLAACLLAGKMGAKKKAARIRNEEWFSGGLLSMEELGLDMVIHPEAETVSHISRVLGIHGAFDYSEAAGGEASLMGFSVQEGLPIIGMPLHKIKEEFALDAFLVIGVLRDGRFLVPSGADSIAAHDKLWVLTAKETEPFVMAIFRQREGRPMRRMVILGASLIGSRLARMYVDRGVAVTLVESDPAVARRAGEQLEKVEVLNVNVESETEFLMDLDPASIDCFVAASLDSKDNMMMSLLAKRIGVNKVVVVTDETTYIPVLDAIGLDLVVNPHNITAGKILTSMRKGMVRSVVMLRAGVADLLEFMVTPGSRMDGKKLLNAGFPKGAIVGMVIRTGELIIPDGETVFEGNDKVIVVAIREKIEAVEKLFASGMLI